MLTFIKKHRLYLAFTIIVGLFWSWVWFINASRITSNNLVAYTAITICAPILFLVSAAAFTVNFRYLKKKYRHDKPYVWLLRAVVVWAFAEALAAWLVAFILMGRNGSLDNVLPFSSLTPFIMYTPLRFLSRFVGFYGLSAVVVVGITGIVLAKTRRLMPFYWLVVLLLTGGAWQLYRQPNQPDQLVTIVSERLDKKVVVDPQNSKLIVLPEYGLDDPLNPDEPPRFQKSSANYNYLGSKQTQVNNGHTNSLIFGASDKGVVKVQAKNRLIPSGEYLPFGIETATYYLSHSTYDNFQVQRAVVKGPHPIQPYRIDNQLIVGAEVCSSIMSTRDYRQLVKKGSTVLTNSASLEIFEGSRLYAWQDQGFATFMAVANARPFLQSSNNWPAFALDQNGKMLAKITPVNQQQISIRPNSTKTPYTYLGEWIAVIGGLLFAADLAQRFRTHRKKKK